MTCHDPAHDHDACCPQVPPLRRLQYFYGQLLSSRDFRDEQSYFRDKLKLAHRCLHGYGVACGLGVRPLPAEEPCLPEDDYERRRLERRRRELGEECEELAARRAELDGDKYPEEAAQLDAEIAACKGRLEEIERLLDDLCPPVDDEKASPRVVVDCGVAIDCLGNEIVVRRPVQIDFWKALSKSDRRHLEEAGGGSVYLSVCFCERPVQPVRPLHGDSCDPSPGCRHAQLEDSYRFQVGLEAPPADERCDPCCCACEEACLLLVRIDRLRPGHAVEAEDVHPEVRRHLGLHDHATVIGASWVHGGHYSDDDAARVLGRDGSAGLELRFSRPVVSSTLTPGVVVVTVYEDFLDGSGRGADIYNLTGALETPPDATTDRLIWRQTSDDKLHVGDMVRIEVKTGFLLDPCCRPVDGEHVGGRVPLLAEHAGDHHPPPAEHETCSEPPHGAGPWRSGNGRGGGSFESWIFIQTKTGEPS